MAAFSAETRTWGSRPAATPILYEADVRSRADGKPVAGAENGSGSEGVSGNLGETADQFFGGGVAPVVIAGSDEAGTAARMPLVLEDALLDEGRPRPTAAPSRAT